MSAGGASIAVLAAVISAFAAIATGVISAFTSWSISKRVGSQKIAEFRKEWIENLRVHLAEFHSTWFILTVLGTRLDSLSENDQEEKRQINEELKEKHERLRYLSSYIEMMLNPSEESHRQMEAHMTMMIQRLIERTKAGSDDQSKETIPVQPRFSELARKVLKAEWDRLKLETK